MIEVTLCMGSSCFSRGNSKALDRLEQVIADEGLSDKVRLSGNVCLGACARGPNIVINGEVHEMVHPDAAVDLLRHYLNEG